MEVKTIKDVDEETWKKFRVMATQNNLKMAILLKMMINEFERNSGDFWKNILKRDKDLSEKEAENMVKVLSESRKEYGFRE